MSQTTARAARGRIPKRGLGVGSAIRRIRELHSIGQEALAERVGITQGYLSLLEKGSSAVTEDILVRLAAALGVEPWMILAQAAGLRLDDVERLSDDERIWLDTYRALNPEQRETVLKVAIVMRRPSARRRDK